MIDIRELGFSHRLADDDEVVDDADDASTLCGDDWVELICHSSDSLLAVWLLALWYCVLMEVAGLCGAHSDCFDQTSLAVAEVNANDSDGTPAPLFGVAKLMVFSSDMREFAKASEDEAAAAAAFD